MKTTLKSKTYAHHPTCLTGIKAKVNRDRVFSEIEQKADRRDLIGGNPHNFTNAFTSNLQCSCFGFPTSEIYALDLRGPGCNLQAGDPLCDYERPIQYLRTAVEKAETSLAENNTGHFQ